MKPQFPLRWRVFCNVVLNLGLIVAVGIVFLYVEFQTGPSSLLLSSVDAKLRDVSQEVINGLEDTPVPQRGEMLDRISRNYDVQLGIYVEGGEYVAGALTSIPEPVKDRLRPPRDRRDPASKAARPRLPRPPEMKKKAFKKGGPQHEIHAHIGTDGYYFIARIPVPTPDSYGNPYGALVIRARTVIFNPQLFDTRPWITVIFVIGGITLVCWFPFIRSLTRAVMQMKAGAEKIANGQFDVKLPANRRDEIGQLNEALNRMANQLNGLVHGQKRFLGDVAHELSAPLARVQANIGIIEERAPESLTRYVEGLHSEIEHMSGLVHELLQFSKAGLTATAPEKTAVRVADVVGRVIEREAAAGATEVRLVEGGDLSVQAHAEGIFRAISNLVRNAVRYAGDAGPVLISARREDEYVLVTVGDHGPGIPEDALDRVFTPFFRVEDSRSRNHGGMGLGMAIVRACVESSGGSVWCSNRKPKGLEVTVRLRAAAV